MDLEADCLEDSIYQHLLYIRHFLWGLRSQASPASGPAQPESIEVEWGRDSCGKGLRHLEQPVTCRYETNSVFR